MKKYIIFSVGIVLSLFMASCQDYNAGNKVDFYDLGTEFFISSDGLTSLDNSATVSIDNQQKNLSSLSVILLSSSDADGNVLSDTQKDLGTIDLTDGSGSMTLTDSQLGISDINYSASLQFSGSYNGKNITRYKTITVADPISIEVPDVNHRIDTVFHVKFSVEPVTETLSSVTVETKVGVAGTYVAEAGPFNATDSIEIKGTDHQVGDTVFVKVTGTAGTKSATSVAIVPIAPYSFSNVETFTLDTTSNQAYDLIEARYVNTTTAGDSADVQFTAAYPVLGGPVEVGFNALNNAQLVKGTADDYSNTDIVTIEATDFSGATTSVPNAAAGDVYIFRTMRGTGDYMYGVLKVTAVNKPQGVLEDSSIEIEYKY
ncbi:hypothetical protein [Prolixibacter sp. SD074]|uniref:hypothetical protein n=1 Tax=Prolixibacter sp. SD074 TaxID=2652391 RepID=UPI00127A8018|nr:hypothetical protein [Prolixibacter sp. SD074]GET29990.1 hypothetical protein SD074_21920 [Prolixibacter sp. SD074]